MRAPGKKQRPRRTAPATISAAAERHITLQAQAGRQRSPPASTAIRLVSASSAPLPRNARRTCAPACRSTRLSPAAAPSTRKSICWSGDWPARPFGIPPRASDGGNDQVVIEPQMAGLLAADARSSAMPNRSCCRGSPICGGAATRWCWNRRAPARCSGFATRRSRPQSPACRRRNRSGGFGGRTAFPGVELLALLVDCQILFRIDAARQRRPAADRGRRQSRALGFSRSPVPHPQHRGTAGQPAGRALSLCRA